MKKETLTRIVPTVLATAALVTALAASRSAPKPPCASIQTDLVLVSASSPPTATIGSQYFCSVNVGAVNCAGGVTVALTLPSGSSYVSSSPAATASGNKLVWQLGDMDQGETRTVIVTLRADTQGSHAAAATVSASPRVVAVTDIQ